MIDCICIEAQINPPENYGEPTILDWKGFNLRPKFLPTGELVVKDYECQVDGLRVLLNRHSIQLSNSLHKFYHGNNYCDFTYSQLVKCIDEICRRFGIEADAWQIKKLEFGFNIDVDKKGLDYLSLFLSYKSKNFHPMLHGGRTYGKKSSLTEYAVKVYDKALQVRFKDKIKLENEILRIEVHYSCRRKLPKGIVTLSDLTKQNNITTLWKSFMEILSIIEFQEEKDFSKSTFEERVLFYASTNSEYLKNEKEIDKKAALITNSKIKQLKARFLKTGFREKLLKDIGGKYLTLFCT